MDMLILILFTFYMPAFVGSGDLGIFYTLGFFNDLFENAPLFTHIIFTTWFFSIYLFVISPSVQFLYRYLILCRNWKPSYRLYTALYSVIVLFILSISILTNARAVYVSRASNSLYRDHIFTDNPTNVDLLVLSRDPTNTLSTIAMLMFIGIPFSIVVVCGIGVWLHFRRHFRVISNTNISSQRLQRQVNCALFLQGGMPIVGNLVSLGLNFLEQKTYFMSFLPHFLTLVIIVINPLLTIFVVDSYRRAVLDILLCRSEAVPKTVNVLTSVVQK